MSPQGAMSKDKIMLPFLLTHRPRLYTLGRSSVHLSSLWALSRLSRCERGWALPSALEAPGLTRAAPKAHASLLSWSSQPRGSPVRLAAPN